MINSGKFTVSGISVDIFITESDADRLLFALKGNTTPSIPPSVTTSSLIVDKFTISKDCIADNNSKKIVSWETNVPSEVVLGDYVGGTSLWMPPNTTWDIVIREKANRLNQVKYTVHSGACGQSGSFNLAGTAVVPEVSQPVIPSTPVVKPPVVATPIVDRFAQIGVSYESKTKARLHFPSHNNHLLY